MIQLLFRFLLFGSSDHISLLARSIGSAITAALLFWVLAPAYIRMLKRRGYCEPSRDFGGLNVAGKAGTPTMGGVLIYLVVLVTAMFWCKATPFALIPLIAGVGFGLIGLMDDLRKVRGGSSEAGIPRRTKYIGQIIMGLLVAFFLFNDFFSPIADEKTRYALFVPVAKAGVYLGIAYLGIIVLFMVAAGVVLYVMTELV